MLPAHPAHLLGRALAGIAAVGLAVTATVIEVAPATGAPTAECIQYETRPDPVTQQPTVVCVRWSRPPGRPAEPEQPENGDDPPSDCWWELYPIPDGVVPDRPAGVSDEAVMYWEICLNDLGNTYVGPGGTQWFEPAAAPAPTPAQVATQLRVEVAASLRDPVVATDPPATEPSIIDVPTFVAVANWQGEQTIPGCDATGTICVTITATPALTFAPGEPGAETVECAPGGTRYDETGPPPEVQAAATGACAYAYTRRTGVDGRPDAWTAAATIAWDVRWQEMGGGASGTFTGISATESFARQVEELRTVVVGVG